MDLIRPLLAHFVSMARSSQKPVDDDPVSVCERCEVDPRSRGERIMDPSKLRKMKIAKRLGVSVQVLDQYLQAKRAEVLQPKTRESEGVTPSREVPKRLRYRAD